MFFFFFGNRILIFAGHETTATALCRALHALAAHPRAQERLKREVVDAFAFAARASDNKDKAAASVSERCPATANGCQPSRGENANGLNGHEGSVDEDADLEADVDVDVDLDKLPYLDAVVRETLRLYPPVYMVHRTYVPSFLLTYVEVSALTLMLTYYPFPLQRNARHCPSALHARAAYAPS